MTTLLGHSDWSFNDGVNIPGSSAGKAPESSQIEIYGADEETLIRLLRTKMKYALAEAGFDRGAQAIVSRLLERNVISCGVSFVGMSVTGNSIETDLVRPQIEDLMSGGFQINSNEVVLLILADQSIDIDISAMRNMREASCSVLRDMFGIFPVRTYLACHPEQDSIGHGPSGFSIAILNVVNTDIGGPSMIQLLDSDICPAEWERMIVSVDAWNRLDLLWSKQKQNLDTKLDGESSEMYDAPELREVVDDQSHTEAGILSVAENEALLKPYEQAEVSVEETAEAMSRRTSVLDTPQPVDHPAMIELRAREASRPDVQHPTWAHLVDGGSLIDLIRAQAAGIEDSVTDIAIVDSESERTGSNRDIIDGHERD